MPITSDYIRASEYERLLSRLPYRYRLPVLLAAETGYRIGDLCRAPNDAYDRVAGTITLQEDKTGKTRTVMLSETAKAALTEIDAWQPVRTLLCVQHGGKKYDRVTVWRWVTATWQEMYIDDRTITPHSFRKLYAVQKRLAGKTLTEVQRDLNHDHPTTTMLYYYADKLAGVDT